jgi:hypothetical protein
MKKLLILLGFVPLLSSCVTTEGVLSNRCNCDNTNLNFWWGWNTPYFNNPWLWDWRWGFYNNFPIYYIPIPNPTTPPPSRYERRRSLPTYPDRTVRPSQPYGREYNDNMYPSNPSRNRNIEPSNRNITPSYDNRRYTQPNYNQPSRNYQNQNIRQPTQVMPRTTTPSNNSTTPYRRGRGNYQ